ncbi:MAG: tetratricopeptide repeat protein [Chloroflexota bacterium]
MRSTVTRRRVRQKAKGPIDPGVGARVRELRLSRGLTQGQLAGADFTKGFVSLLETGRTRASLRAAGILAARLGVPISDLLRSDGNLPELELHLLRAEQMLSSGQAREVGGLLQPLIAGSEGALRAKALRIQGRALIDAGDDPQGLEVLERAGVELKALGLHELAIRTLYDRAIGHAHLDEPGNALTLALECEAAMQARGLTDRTLELQIKSLIATTFARAGDLETASLQGERALAMAEDVVDPEALGSLYSTMAMTRQRQGDLEAALTYARKGLELFESLGRDRAVAQLWHNLAVIRLARREYGKAAEALDRGEALARQGKLASLEARLLSLRGELAAARGNWRQAQTLATAAGNHPAALAQTRGKAFLLQARAATKLRAPASRVLPLLDKAVAALANEPSRVRAEAHHAYAAILADRTQWKDAYAQAHKAYELSTVTLHSESASKS